MVRQQAPCVKRGGLGFDRACARGRRPQSEARGRMVGAVSEGCQTAPGTWNPGLPAVATGTIITHASRSKGAMPDRSAPSPAAGATRPPTPAAALIVASAKLRRYSVLPRLGIEPTPFALVRSAIGAALDSSTIPTPGVTALDAGCGRRSELRTFRRRIGRIVGADIHLPVSPLPWLDEFAIVDVCRDDDAFPPETFDLELTTFTVEHFADPERAFANMWRWLRPGGTLVATTVNRRHPMVAAYLALPAGPRGRLQAAIKASPDDAHPLIGACNSPTAIVSMLRRVGYDRIEVACVGHLTRSWGRRWLPFAVGLVGDLVAQPFPTRRSTIVVVARKPSHP